MINNGKHLYLLALDYTDDPTTFIGVKKEVLEYPYTVVFDEVYGPNQALCVLEYHNGGKSKLVDEIVRRPEASLVEVVKSPPYPGGAGIHDWVVVPTTEKSRPALTEYLAKETSVGIVLHSQKSDFWSKIYSSTQATRQQVRDSISKLLDDDEQRKNLQFVPVLDPHEPHLELLKRNGEQHA